MPSQHLSIAREDYLQTIMQLEEEGIPVIRARLAERLKVSAPSVSEAIRSLANDNMITIQNRRFIVLTDEGHLIAHNIVRRHRVAERILTDLLHLPWHVAHEEAHVLEHGLSDRVVDAAMDVLGNPTTCPHGSPIPGSTYIPREMAPLKTLSKGTIFTLERLSESVEFQPEIMEYFENAGFTPGIRATVRDVSPDGSFSIDSEDSTISISAKMAGNISVSIPEMTAS